jgi:MYXO-CTERM domain-containing protein
MNEPYVVDADGVRHVARVAVAGCAVDTSPLPPWGRPVTDPGSPTCEVHVGWGDVAYPALLDPAWTDTENTLAAERKGHTATKLGDGKVLIVGGQRGSTEYLTSTEIFDPGTNTFAAGPSLTTGRSFHVAVRRSDDSVVVAGGRDGSGNLASTEIYPDPLGVSEDFGAGPDLGTARREAKAQVITGDNVLIAGGIGAGGVLASSEVLGFVSGTWGTVRTMSAARRGHVLLRLSTGRTMVIAGLTLSGSDLSTSEIYTSDTWQTITGQLSYARYYHAGAALTDGRVLVAGGYSRGWSRNIEWTEVFSPTTGIWSSAGNLASTRQYHTLTALANGAAIAVGGATTTDGDTVATGGYRASTEIFDPTANVWRAGPALDEARAFHTATLLDDGRVLVTGGEGPLTVLSSAQVFGLDSAGMSCTAGSTCATGFCVDGVCCDTACDGLCVSCLAAETGGADGTCAGVTAGTDPGNECVDSGAAECGTNGFCNGFGACQTYPSYPCTPNPCTSGSECASGQCVDGICCDRACAGTCEACTAAKKGWGTDGSCDYIVAGSDPDSECAAMGTGVCAGEGACDGLGGCQSSQAGEICSAAGCIDQRTYGYEVTCSTLGECNTSPVDCGTYACDPVNTPCHYTCSSDAQCAPGIRCISGSCVANPNGSPCAVDSDCQSYQCRDGVCCDSGCSGQCEACDVAGFVGQCVAITGAPRGNRGACTGTGECAGTCDGTSRYDCTYPDRNTVCGETRCELGIIAGEMCDGQGNCVRQGDSCYPYTCDGNVCGETCSSDADCGDGARCDASQLCVPPGSSFCVTTGTIEDPSGATRDCLPYACRAGACMSSCEDNDDCSSGNICYTVTNTCGRPRDKGCGCSTVGAPPGGGLWGLATALGLAFWRRRTVSPRRR